MSETKICPFCAEEIKAAAIKCKHCGSTLESATLSKVNRPLSSPLPSGTTILPSKPQETDNPSEPLVKIQTGRTSNKMPEKTNSHVGRNLLNGETIAYIERPHTQMLGIVIVSAAVFLVSLLIFSRAESMVAFLIMGISLFTGIYGIIRHILPSEYAVTNQRIIKLHFPVKDEIMIDKIESFRVEDGILKIKGVGGSTISFEGVVNVPEFINKMKEQINKNQKR